MAQFSNEWLSGVMIRCISRSHLSQNLILSNKQPKLRFWHLHLMTYIIRILAVAFLSHRKWRTSLVFTTMKILKIVLNRRKATHVRLGYTNWKWERTFIARVWFWPSSGFMTPSYPIYRLRPCILSYEKWDQPRSCQNYGAIAPLAPYKPHCIPVNFAGTS